MAKLGTLLNPALRQKFVKLGTGETYRQAIRDINNAPIPRITTHYNKKHQLERLVVTVFEKGRWSKKEYYPNFDSGQLTMFYVGYYFEELTIDEFIDKYSYKK